LGDLKIDWGKHVVSLMGNPVELTSKEYELLRALIDARGRVLGRETLLNDVWGYDRSLDIETRTVDLHISQLRRKLRHVADRILTVKNAGYRFVLDE
jgi:DNA-binding response OmpR family regulator